MSLTPHPNCEPEIHFYIMRKDIDPRLLNGTIDEDWVNCNEYPDDAYQLDIKRILCEDSIHVRWLLIPCVFSNDEMIEYETTEAQGNYIRRLISISGEYIQDQFGYTIFK